MKSQVLYLMTLLFSSLLVIPEIAAAADPEIKFYRLSRDKRIAEIEFILGTKDTGCHNFTPGRKVHRVSVIGFEFCSLFSESNCDKDSALKAKWKGRTRIESKKHPLIELTQGSRWYLDPKTNVKAQSWYCKGKAVK